MEKQKAEGARKAWKGSGEAATETIWFEMRESSARPSSSATTPRRPKASSALVKDGKEVQSLGRREGRVVSTRRRSTRVRRPGRRHRRDRRRRAGSLRVTDTQKKAGDLRAFRQGEKGTLKPGDAVELEGRPRAPLAPSAPITRRRICCTRRCARCSAITSRRRARWSRRTAALRLQRTQADQADELRRRSRTWPTPIVLQNAGRHALMAVDEAHRRGRHGAVRREVRRRGARRLDGRCRRQQALGWSVELCGGTHVAHRRHRPVQGRGESAVAAGVRRIEALTGEARA
jgi:alanyl-tRNA synthetase